MEFFRTLVVEAQPANLFALSAGFVVMVICFTIARMHSNTRYFDVEKVREEKQALQSENYHLKKQLKTLPPAEVID